MTIPQVAEVLSYLITVGTVVSVYLTVRAVRASRRRRDTQEKGSVLRSGRPS